MHRVFLERFLETAHGVSTYRHPQQHLITFLSRASLLMRGIRQYTSQKIPWGKSVKTLRRLILPAILVAFPLAALADDWKDESGHGKGRHRREYKEEYWDGNCKVKREFKKDGEYKEKRKCKGPEPGYYAEPVYVPAAPAVIIEPGITIHGTVRIPQ